MKSFPITILMVFYSISIYSQVQLKRLNELLPASFEPAPANHQFSSICKTDTCYFMVEEKNHKLVSIRLDYSSKWEHDINGVNSNSEFESITWYRKTLFMLDDASGAVYWYDMDKHRAFELEMYPLPDRSSGFEGLAIAPGENFYILQEGNKDSLFAYLYCYLLLQDHLHLVKRYDVPKDKGERFTDLYYDDSTKSLLALGSKYNNDPSDYYFIDTMPLMDTVKPDVGKSSRFLTLSAPEVIKQASVENKGKMKQIYSTNLEGLTKANNGSYIIVSDDCECDADSEGKYKTLFLEVTRTP